MSPEHISDVVYATLKKESHAGENRNQKMISWLKSEGAVGDDLMGLWKTYFDIKGVTPGSHNDRMLAWLALEGFSGYPAVNDRWKSYWDARLLLP